MSKVEAVAEPIIVTDPVEAALLTAYRRDSLLERDERERMRELVNEAMRLRIRAVVEAAVRADDVDGLRVVFEDLVAHIGHHGGSAAELGFAVEQLAGIAGAATLRCLLDSIESLEQGWREFEAAEASGH
jgi:hypothetical protein